MNYQEFNDDETQLQEFNIQNLTETLLQQILQLNLQINIPLSQAIYLTIIEQKQFNKLNEATNNNLLKDHFFTLYNTNDQCAICNKAKKDHQINCSIIYNISIIYSELQNQIKYFRVCQICLNYVLQQKLAFFDGKIHDICVNCFQCYLEVQIQEGKVMEMKCPHCESKLNEAIIDQFAPTMKNKFLRFLKNYEIAISKNKFWCPNVRCQNIIEFNNNQVTKECENCQTVACVKCRQLIHPNITCEEYFLQLTNGWQLEQNIRKCPQCQFLSQKLSGCDLMTCYYCKITWCWLCGKPATYSHVFFCPSITPGLNADGSVSNYFKFIGWYIFLLLAIIFILILLLITLLLKESFFLNSPIIIQILLFILFACIGVVLTPFFIFFGSLGKFHKLINSNNSNYYLSYCSKLQIEDCIKKSPNLINISSGQS